MSRPELIKDVVNSIAEYVPGKSIEEIAKKYGIDPIDIIKLGSNENVLGPSQKAVEALISYASKVNIYPSADASELVEALSVYTGLPVENICASGPGMDGLLDNLMRVLIEPGDEVVIPTPTFSYYEIAARANGATAIHVAPGEGLKFDITAIKEAITERTKVVFLCSPNNPTGLLTSEDDVRSLLESTNGLVFVDEAYVEFSDKSLSKLVLEYDNLVIGRTFSKAFGLAGLRIGYGLMPEWLKVQYMKIATPFNVSLPAVMAGVAALSDSEYLEKSISMTVEGRKFLTENIPFKVYDSRANFILVDVSPLVAKDVSESLMKKGIIVRDCRSFRNAGESLIRVTVGTREQNEKVVSAFEEAKAVSN
ncbi:MAG: histidinol-phosphate aminotransferase [Methanolobus sp.]|uniref:histidinol-phosphate transaminase n=1 Tax=Methanolobus sp. TaxID=1874737 RepID=UPI0024AAAB24|nr:histidinol-phosphate transaminase [Methanolobus sp.]MDI3485903.1 histidinol-phosphate aminotransferase [Methanolobus sp.]MDK2832422.1 histidinol-phosphate aminotransferase [Methanolobus sp.]